MTAKRLCGVWFGAALLASSPAGALEDLTGVYQGSLSCDSTTDAESARTKIDGTLYVDDHGGGNVYAYLNNSLQTFHAAAVSTPEKPDQGRLAGPSCSLSPATGGWLMQAVVKAKAGQASLKGAFITAVVGAGSHQVQVCRFSLKRISLGDPGIPPCP